MTYVPFAPSPVNLSVGAVMDITPRPPIVFVEGHGSWLKDQDGKDYLDFIQGWAVNALGHCPTVIVEAVAKQAATLINCAPSFFNEPMIRLAQLIVDSSGLGQVFFANSGAEANEGAIKLARKWGRNYRDGAFEIVTLDHGFHGRTLATMSASGKAQWDGLFEPRVSGFPKARINDIASVERAITDKTAAIMLEPIQGEAGVIVAESDFLKDLRALTRQKGVLLILDEVQTGLGRTGKMFAFQHDGIRPDIMTLGKGLGGGVPIAALVADQSVCCFDYGDQGGTFNGNPLVTAVGCAVFEEIAKLVFLESVTRTGAYLERRLNILSETHHCLGVRGTGLLLALDLGREIGAEIVAEALRRGLLLNAPRPHLLRFMPALNVTEAEVDRMIGILDGVLGNLLSR